ncbi:hypothetical protein [Emcibacter sp. SYSU 3D8]|uniref:hypothetical protein n=1 Tax=Emcibacter sp. SYSU 3D8 TaxID=3133969 RepID=UPI0031FF3B28
MTRGKRIALGVVFVIFLVLCGLVAGTFVGGRFFVPPGSGLAGPAIALGYGLLGAAVAGVAGGLLAYFLPPKWLLGAALPVSVAGLLIGIKLTDIYLDSARAGQAHLEQAYNDLNKFRFVLVHHEPGAPFQRLEADWGQRRYVVVSEGRQCAGPLSGKEAVALLGALREVEGLVYRTPDPCAGSTGSVERELDWFIPEHLPPDTQGKHAITASCAALHPELEKPFEAATEIFSRGGHRKRCQ